MQFRLLNNITGWLVFAAALTVYTLTVEPTASFWDCGEFIAVSYKLMVPHPPGAPFFLLIGRLFSLFASDVTQVAFWVNMVSVVSSAFTSLFLFWAITLLTIKALGKNQTALTMPETVLTLGAGLVGALAYTFSDTAWFSAAETEVYAMSSFFTAFVFWAILRWEQVEDESIANRWIILIAYTIGLSIGVHLLNLLAIPAIGLLYYFKRYSPNVKGILITLVASAAILLFILSGIIPGLPTVAGKFEIFFVNSLGMPFGSGIIVFAIAFIAALAWSIRYSIQKGNVPLNTALLSFAYIVIGYSCYGLVLVRSNFNPPIDENDPENIITFVSYLKREQYGDRPLLNGPTFLAQPVKQERTTPLYRKAEDRYEIFDYKIETKYDPKQISLLPRMYDTRADRVEAYYRYTGMAKGKKPTLTDQIVFMVKYQIGHMWWRYFMWNFAGREGIKQDSGWLTPFDTDKDLPELLRMDEARNNYFMLPFILGIAGAFWHFGRHKKDFSVVALMFFFTGIAVILYLNQPPNEPRERDYTSVGSFYVFAIWIGMSVLFLYELLAKLIKPTTVRAALALLVALAIPFQMLAEAYDDHDRSERFFAVDSARNMLNSCAKNAVLFTGGDNDTFPLWYVQNVEGFRTDVRVVVLSYLTADWYIKQLRDKHYDSDPLPISLTPMSTIQGKNDYLQYVENPQLRGAPLELNRFLKLINDNHPAIQVSLVGGGTSNTLPTRNFFLNVNKPALIEKGVVRAEDTAAVVQRFDVAVKGNNIFKNDLMILDIIANAGWERPVYFNNTSLATTKLELKQYMQMEGMTYRLLPVAGNPNDPERVATDIMYDNIMNKMFWRNLDKEGVFYDEEHVKFVMNSRNIFVKLAENLAARGETEKAKEVVTRCLEVMPDRGIPFDVTMPGLVQIMMRLGMQEEANKVADTMVSRADELVQYYLKKGERKNDRIQEQMYILNYLAQIYQGNTDKDRATRFQELFSKNASALGV
jgi:hypothetical protein